MMLKNGKEKRGFIQHRFFSEMKKNGAGFTMLELLLTTAAFAIIIAIAIPFSNSSIVRGNLDNSARSLESSMRRAYTYARGSENNSDWGVRVSTSSVIVFSGSTYAGRDSVFDEIGNMSSPALLGGTLASDGVAEITFAKGTGTPNATGTITLTGGGNMKIITINDKGAISVTHE